MFGDAELPLALIMEEILEWEKPEKKVDKTEKKQQVPTTFEKS